ncbi:MAG: hypothetical protein ACHQ0J_15465 [Candidatus Dormibacterales bacterium]
MTTNNTLRAVSAAYEFTVNGQTITGYQPFASVYATTGADMNVHVYGLNLTNASVQPSPQQISNLSLASTALICDESSAETNLLDPTSLFIVLHLAGTGGTCGTTTATGDQWVLMNYTDSATTAPTPLTITTTDFTALYSASGALTGIVSLDPASSNVYFYTSKAFTSPTTLVGGIMFTDTLDDIETLKSENVFTSSLLWLGVTTAAGVESLYTITNNGVATKWYTAQGSLDSGANGGVDDSSQVYFTDTYTSGASQQAHILAFPRSGGASMTLYTTASAAPLPTLVGSNDSVLVYYTTSNVAPVSATLWTLPDNAPNNPTQLGATLTGSISNARMYAPVGAGPSSDSLFVTVRANAGAVVSYSTEVLTPNGGTLQALLAGSVFLDKATALSGTELQIKGITDTDGGDGGGTIYNVNIGTLAAQALHTTGGAAFQVPAGNEMSFAIGESTTIGVAAYSSFVSGGSSTTGLAYDLSQSLIVPVTVTNANTNPGF